MSTLHHSTRTAVGDWVTQYPQTARILEDLQIDYCCGGNRSLDDACQGRGLDAEAVLTRLEEAVRESDECNHIDWNGLSLGELCDRIESTHHAYLRTELPRLSSLIEKVTGVHGARHPELAELQAVFADLRGELEPHMFKEERILFPAIRQLDRDARTPPFAFGTVANPIRMMEHEHEQAGAALQRIRQLTRDFSAPQDACNTWRVMLDGLRELEADMHQHIHKENNILFPKAQRREAGPGSS